MIFFHLKRKMYLCIALSVLLSVIFGAAWTLNSSGYDASFKEKEVAEVAGRLETLQQNPTNVTYKLLAVQGDFDHSAMGSAEYLIQNLTRYNNWQNTTGYTSYIHLLMYAGNNKTNIWQQYWKGAPTMANIINEITNFLNQTLPGEDSSNTIRILYYIGHTTRVVEDNKTSYHLHATHGNVPIPDSQLDKLLHPSNGPLSNSNSTLVILDTCYSGGYIENITRSGTMVLAAACAHQLAQGWITGNPSPGFWGWFTGHANASFINSTNFGPLGIIGAIRNETDINNDGWGSAGEIFTSAHKTTIAYDIGEHNGTALTQVPQCGSGVAGGAIPLVQYNSSSSFPGIGARLNNPIGPQQAVKFIKVKPSPTFNLTSPSWPMYGKDPSHRRLSEATGPTTNTLLWNRNILVSSTSSPAISVQAMSFIVNKDGDVYALDTRNGDVIWSLKLNTTVSCSSPARSNGILYVATSKGTSPSGRLYAIDAFTGKPRWNFAFPTGYEAFASPTVAGETVYITTFGGGGSGGGIVYALNMFTGAVRWSKQTNAPIYSSPAVADGMVFFASSWNLIDQAYFYALNQVDGSQMWNYSLNDNGVYSSPAVFNGRVYIGIMGGGMYPPQVIAFNETTPTVEWSFPTTVSVSSSPAVDRTRNMVIAASDDGIVYALNAGNGLPIWQTPPGIIGPINMSSPAISNNSLIYIGSTDGRLYCLNETNGQQVWNYYTAGQIISSPALTQEHVLFASKDGNLYCLGPQFPVHDVAASSLQVQPTAITQGNDVSINYTVKNLGNRIETFNVTIAYNTTTIWTPPGYNEPTTIHTQQVTLQPGGSTSRNYEWKTSGIQPRNYTILIIAELVNYEIDPSNNVCVNQTIEIREKPPPVGGVWIPVDKFSLLAPYIALASTILVATAATAIYFKRRNKKR